jgi:hypothetical protein
MKEDKPPFAKNWNVLYLLLVLALAAFILVFNFISRHYS